jgi:hypothetical protein
VLCADQSACEQLSRSKGKQKSLLLKRQQQQRQEEQLPSLLQIPAAGAADIMQQQQQQRQSPNRLQWPASGAGLAAAAASVSQ